MFDMVMDVVTSVMGAGVRLLWLQLQLLRQLRLLRLLRLRLRLPQVAA